MKRKITAMPDLSIIIPYAGEYPHLHYTLQSLWCDLNGVVDFEVLAIRNGPKTTQQGFPDGHPLHDNEAAIRVMTDDFRRTPWLRHLEYSEKLSCWGARNFGVRESRAENLLFLDAHCGFGGLWFTRGLRYWLDTGNGEPCHFPIADFLKPDDQWKQYAIDVDMDSGIFSHHNTAYDGRRDNRFDDTIGWKSVPASPNCGLMCRKDIITDVLEYWPDELGQYGGGENYFNGTMALTGHEITMIDPGRPIYHWHIPGVWSRDHKPTVQSWARNIMIATYLVCGEEWLHRLMQKAHEKFYPINTASPIHTGKYLEEILESGSLRARRERIKAKSVTTIEEWAKKWSTK